MSALMLIEISSFAVGVSETDHRLTVRIAAGRDAANDPWTDYVDSLARATRIPR